MLSDLKTAHAISDFIKTYDEVFNVDDFIRVLKDKGVKITKKHAEDVLRSSDYVFALVNNEFVTRAGVFSGRWFSFMPSREEVEKDEFLIGHRCMPFVNPDINPDSVSVYSKNGILESHATVFSMNLAFDVFAFYGEGYVLPYIFNDNANDEVRLQSIQYQMPEKIKLTSWPLSGLCADGETFEYGDRVLCRVVDWDNNVVEMQILKNESKGFVVSNTAIARNEWYSYFEEGLLKSFDRNGPTGSIEEQLALLFLENQEQLCNKTCGSSEEFLKHTKKIGFSPFGVETRIWRVGEDVPYIGEWNKNFEKEVIMNDLSMTFSPQVIDAFLENNIYKSTKNEKTEEIQDIIRKVFPSNLKMSQEERGLLLLNIEKRNDILEKEYNQFDDYKIAKVRQRVLELFTEVNALLCEIGCSGLDMEDFPQQEMVILTQLFTHIVRVLEEIQNSFMRESFPIADVNMSLDGMEETFESIGETLAASLKVNRIKGFELIK